MKRYLRLYRNLGLPPEELDKLTDVELDKLFGLSQPKPVTEKQKAIYEYCPELEKKLRKPGNTRRRLWETDYIVKHPDGYLFTQFTCYYAKWLRANKPVMHMEHKAGDKMYIDYAGKKLHIVNPETGELKEVECFISVLGASQLTYFDATESQQKEDFIRSCENALHYYGGVPLAIVPDNLKSAVTKSDKYEPTINEAFGQFADHYSSTVLPARAYKPKDKSLVEGAVKIIYNRVYSKLEKQTFFTLESLNEALRGLLEEYNAINFTNRTYSRRKLFEEIERAYLQPLPSKRFILHKVQIVTVSKYGHVCLTEDKHYYSVPHSYIGKQVKICYTQQQVLIYHNYLCIACHQRNKSPYGYTTLPEHLAPQHKYLALWNPEKYISQAKEIDPAVLELIERVLVKRQHIEQSYKSCEGILRLSEKVEKEQFINACKLALDYQQYSYKQLLEILERRQYKLKQQEDASSSEAKIIPLHPNIRGEAYYQ